MSDHDPDLAPAPAVANPAGRLARALGAVAQAVHGLEGVSRPVKQAVLIATDAVLMVLCFVAAGLLQGAAGPLPDPPSAWLALAGFVVVALATFARLGLYRAVTRYITGTIMPMICAGTALGLSALLVVDLVLGTGIGPGVALIHGLLVLQAVAALRFAIRSVIRKPILRNTAPVIIYGAGRAGQQLVAAFRLGREYKPVAFVDDDPRLHRSTISGVRVHPAVELRALAARFHAKDVLLAMPSISRARRRRIVSQLETLGVQVKTIPGIADLVSGQARFTDLRPVTPEDLLGRDPVPPRSDLMRRNIAGKVVMVTGAGGTIGAELCRQIMAQRPARLVLLDVSEYALYAISTELQDRHGPDAPDIVPVLGSVQNPSRVRACLRRFGVQTIYHAAAYKHVHLVEDNVIEAVRNNVFGTRILAQAATEAGVESFILVSTDKTVRPTSVMGATKRLAELICQAEAAKGARTLFSIVRFGNVLGSSGSVIPRFRDQIERGGPVTVTHPEVTRYFMTITEAAQLVVQAGALARGGDVFVLDMGQPVRILDLARSMIRQYGLTPYMLDDEGAQGAEKGDIAIQITGLRKGEKLYEELLIGNNPEGTDHPRIITAAERAMDPAALDRLLDRLANACAAFDLDGVITILQGAPLDFQDQVSGAVIPFAPPPAAAAPQGGAVVLGLANPR